MIEPFVSVIVAFGGVYLLWTGVLWMRYIIIISGFLMTATFLISSFIILKELIIVKKQKTPFTKKNVVNLSAINY